MPQVAAALVPIAINAAIGIGVSVLASALQPKQASATTLSTDTGFSFELQTGEGVPVSAVLGRGRAKGQLIYHNSYGDDNEYLQIVIKAGHGWHDGLEALLIDEKQVTLSGSNDDPKGLVVDSFVKDGTPYMWVKWYDGRPGQAADPELVANANPSDRWTSAHTMTGCAYYILTCRYQADLYGGTIPLSGSVWRGLRLFDWRDHDCIWGDPATYVFSTNPAVIRYNYRRGIYVNGVRVLGQGFSAWAGDIDGYTAAANRCDEEFYDPETDTTFPVYAYGREVGDDEAKLDVLAELDQAYCGTSFKRGGADVPLPGQQLVSLMTLTDGDRLRGYAVQADRKGAVSAKKTMWHGQFVSADAGYELAAYAPRIDTALETLIGGRKSVAMDQPYEWLQPRAQLRAEVALRRQFYPATRVETFTPKAFVLEPGDPVTRRCEWGDMLMVVQKVSRVFKDNKLVGVTLTLQQWDNTIVPASGDSFVVLPAEPGPGPADPHRTIAVSGLNMVPADVLGGGAIHAFGKATWTPITDPNVDQVMIRLWPTAGTEANDKLDFFADSKLTSTKLCGPLAPDTPYTYRAIPIRKDARTCVFTSTGAFTSGSESPPAGSVDFDQLTLRYQALINLFRDATASFDDALARISQVMGEQDASHLVVSEEIQAQLGDAVASFTQEIAVLADDNLATALLVQSLNAALGGNSASVNVVWEVAAAPDGYSARYVLRAEVNDGSLRQASMFLDVPANPADNTRIGFSADQIVFFASDGTPISYINSDGEQISANGAVYINMKTGAVRLTAV